jgi:hypothetical protein
MKLRADFTTKDENENYQCAPYDEARDKHLAARKIVPLRLLAFHALSAKRSLNTSQATR